MARRAAAAHHGARACRRPAPAGRRSRADGAAVYPPQAGLCGSTPADRRHASRARGRRTPSGVDRVLMRYLILSDIHANIEALDAALAAAGRYDHALVLGDLVGYGANPDEVIDRIRSLPSATLIRGNHDKVATGLATVESFNHLARQAIQWTASILSADRREWLAALPAGPETINDAVEICHGAPFDEDVYIFDDLDVRRAFKAMRRPLCLLDRKSTRLNSSHSQISYAVFCLKKKKYDNIT